MIFRLLLLIALPFAAWYVAKAISQRYSFNARQNRYLFVVMAALLLVGALIMLGKLPVHWILAPLGAIGAFLLRMLPAALRLLPLWQILGSRIASGATTPRKTSSLRTEYLDVELDHASGELEGTVLLGQFSGRKLSSMALPELLQLREECEHDADSRQVLKAYLDRNHPGWHDDAEGRENSADSAGETALGRVPVRLSGPVARSLLRAGRVQFRRAPPSPSAAMGKSKRDRTGLLHRRIRTRFGYPYWIDSNVWNPRSAMICRVARSNKPDRTLMYSAIH